MTIKKEPSEFERRPGARGEPISHGKKNIQADRTFLFVIAALGISFAIPPASWAEPQHSSVHPFEARIAVERLMPLAGGSGNELLSAGLAAALVESGVKLAEDEKWPLNDLVERAKSQPTLKPIRLLIDRIMPKALRQLEGDQQDFNLATGEMKSYQYSFRPAPGSGSEIIFTTSLNVDFEKGDIDIRIENQSGEPIAEDIGATGRLGTSTFVRFILQECQTVSVVLENVGEGDADGSMYFSPRADPKCPN